MLSPSPARYLAESRPEGREVWVWEEPRAMPAACPDPNMCPGFEAYRDWQKLGSNWAALICAREWFEAAGAL